MANGALLKDVNRSPENLIGLAALYLAQNLLEPAEEVLAKIQPEHDLYVKAAELQIEIHSRKENFQEVVRLSKELMNRGNIAPWLAAEIGAAYYLLGQTSNARLFFLKSMTEVPDNNEVRRRLQSLRPRNPRPKIEALIMEGLEIGISPHVALDCIAPILWGGRCVTCCFQDQIIAHDEAETSESEEQNSYLKFASDLYQRFGIFTAFLPYIQLSQNRCAPLIKLFFSLDPSVFDRVDDIKQSAWSEFKKQEGKSSHRLESLEKEGALLGYPECCTEWVLNNRRSNKSIETLALTALIEEEYVCSLEPGKNSPSGLAYFAFEFYPCNPRCIEAERIGYDIFEHYRKSEVHLSEIYCQHVLSVNKAKMYYPLSLYADFIGRFNDTIIRDLAIEEFKKTHPDFDLYSEEMSVILKEYPYFENLEALPLLYAMAKERASHRFAGIQRALAS